MNVSYKDKIVHSYKDIKTIKKSINNFIDEYEDVLNNEDEDLVYEARNICQTIENNLKIEVYTTLGE